MKLISTRGVGLCALAWVAAGCAGDSSEAPASEAAAAESPMAAGTAPAAPTMGGLLNPNLAGEPEMVALGVPAEVAAGIVESRPFMDMLALDAALSGSMDEAARQAFYAKAWVPLNLNTASRDEILLVPGAGERMAREFDEYRPYAAMAEFRREMAKYVDDAEVERLAQYVFVPIDLNTASREQILALPGVGERMAHEFEEYRPYTSMDQFRREMGKYVDEAEVARLARLVTIN